MYKKYKIFIRYIRYIRYIQKLYIIYLYKLYEVCIRKEFHDRASAHLHMLCATSTSKTFQLVASKLAVLKNHMVTSRSR